MIGTLLSLPMVDSRLLYRTSGKLPPILRLGLFTGSNRETGEN